MKKKTLSCFFPTKVLLVDDDISFLKSICMSLTSERATYQTFDSPQAAQKFLNEEYVADPFSKRVLSHRESYDLDTSTVNFNIREIFKEVYNNKRFQQISTLVVDYAMPGMNGLELCKSIKDETIQKILLTGAADEHLAVDAFNDGIINKFIPKQSRDMPAALKAAIEDAQHRHFLTISKEVTHAMFQDTSFRTALRDPVYIDFFYEIVQKLKVAEFYLFEFMGSYIFVDENGKTSGLFLKDEDMLMANYMEIEDEETLPDSLKKDIKSGKKMLCYFSPDGNPYPKIENWEKYIYPAKKINGEKSTYFYAAPCDIDCIESNKVTTYKDYRKDFYAKSK